MKKITTESISLILQILTNMPLGDYKELVDLVECLKKDFEKFYLKGIKISGTRIRAGLQDIKRKVQEIRVDIQKTKKSDCNVRYSAANTEAAIARGRALGARKKKNAAAKKA